MLISASQNKTSRKRNFLTLQSSRNLHLHVNSDKSQLLALCQSSSEAEISSNKNKTGFFLDKYVSDFGNFCLDKPRTLLHIAKIACRKILMCHYDNVSSLDIPSFLRKYLLQNSRYFSGWWQIIVARCQYQDGHNQEPVACSCVKWRSLC